MIHTKLTAILKRAVIPGLTISLIGALAALYVKNPSYEQSPSSSQRGASDIDASQPMAVDGRNGVGADNPSLSSADRLAGITVVILNNGKDLPLGIKVGGQYILIPGPSSWSRGTDNGSATSEKNNFLAGIIDTSDVLSANGFKPDDPFSFAIGDTELNAANTFRIAGNHQAASANNDGNDYAVGYRTQAGDGGIWRTLTFKNIVLSYGQAPSLADYLVSPGAAVNAISYTAARDDQYAAGTDKTTLTEAAGQRNLAQVTPLEEPTAASTRKDLEALDSPSPAIRADAIQNLILNGYHEANTKEADVKMGTLIDKTLQDNSPDVREATLDSLDGYDGPIPQDTLSRAALTDKNPALRIHALELLAERFGNLASPAMKEAINDPDPRVGRMAKQLLSDLADKQQQ